MIRGNKLKFVSLRLGGRVVRGLRLLRRDRGGGGVVRAGRGWRGDFPAQEVSWEDGVDKKEGVCYYRP